MLIIFADVSKIKELEKATKELKYLFFQSMAHELRTPLNSIIPLII